MNRGYRMSEVDCCRVVVAAGSSFFFKILFISLFRSSPWATGTGETVMFRMGGVCEGPADSLRVSSHPQRRFFLFLFPSSSFSRENNIQIMSSADPKLHPPPPTSPKNGLCSHRYYERAQRNSTMKHKSNAIYRQDVLLRNTFFL